VKPVEREISGGRWRIFERPRETNHYCIGVDTASGKENANESVAQVLCVETGFQVAILAGQIHPEDMATEVEKVGYYYNEAEIAVERELHGETIIQKLKDRYPRMFFHEESLSGFGEQSIKQYGWDPRRYRQAAIDWLQQDIGYASSDKPEERKMGITVVDAGTISQLGYFIRNKKTGKWEAAPGKMDDRVSALYIANYVRRMRYRIYTEKVEIQEKKLTYLDRLATPVAEDDEDDRRMDFGDW
jgi:hypothetical protein